MNKQTEALKKHWKDFADYVGYWAIFAMFIYILNLAGWLIYIGFYYEQTN